MKRFSHLSKVEIRDIVTSFHNGEPKLSIAKRLGIDRSTVIYHIRKYERSYPEQSTVYALVRTEMREECTHPSLKCSLCGMHKDAIKREEKLVVADLRQKLRLAYAKLEEAGIPVE